jgi:hypothetical protein
LTGYSGGKPAVDGGRPLRNATAWSPIFQHLQKTESALADARFHLFQATHFCQTEKSFPVQNEKF